MNTTQHPSCRICANPFYPFPVGEKEGYQFISCKACGSVFCEPWPTPSAIEQFYADIQPEIVHIIHPDNKIRFIAKRIAKIIPGELAGKSFLDVSSRQGYTVAAARSLGMKARGIDPFLFFAEFARQNYGIESFENKTLVEDVKDGKTADLVFCIQAFCEQTDPNAFAAALAQSVSPGGTIYIEEPDGNHFNVPRYFSSWPIVEPPINFLYPSKKGMEKLLARHGLKIKKSFFTWAPYMRLIVVKK